MVLDTTADLSLKDKIVVVTGGGSGISLSFVQIAHSLGAKVVIGDLRLTLEAEAFVQKAGDERIAFQVCDVTNWENLEQLEKTSLDKYGDVPEVWIAGAGVFEPPFSNFWYDPEPASKSRYAEVEINVAHPVKLTRIAFRSLLGRNKKGTVLIISSIAGLQGNYAAPLYCATKWAVVGLVRSLAEAESREGVRVLCICPGLVHTPLWTDRPDTMNNFEYKAEHALLPSDVAERMIEMCQQSKFPGGTVLETSVVGNRVIPEWNIDPPSWVTDADVANRAHQGSGTSASGESYSHIKELMNKGRGLGLK